MKNCSIEISAPALRHNIKVISKKLPKKSKLLCVIKANAYGHGFDEVSTILKDVPLVDWFGVFDFNDAIRLRQKTKKPILVLANTPESFWDTACKEKISITLSAGDELKQLTKYENNKKLKWHLKVDTGLGRQGLLSSDMLKTVALLDRHSLKPEGLYSHFSGVEEKQFDKYSFNQYTMLIAWKNALSAINLHPLLHISGTAGVLRHDLFGLDMVRIGLGTYGLWPSQEVKKTVSDNKFLKPVLSFKTHISEMKTLPGGAKVAYDCTHTLTQEAKVAIRPVGYWDGLPRTLSSKGIVLVRGKRAPIIGRIMMNMCVIDTTHIPAVKQGDTVTIIGKDKTEEVTTDEFASLAGTINYEVVTRLNPTIERKITGLQKKAK